MVVSEFGRSGLSLLMVGSGAIPQYLGIGSGSGAEIATLGSLIAEVLSQRKLWTTRDIGTSKEVNWLFDFDSVTMSGVFLREFGLGQSQTKGTNDLWNREGFTAVEFDGTNECQVQITFQVV